MKLNELRPGVVIQYCMTNAQCVPYLVLWVSGQHKRDHAANAVRIRGTVYVDVGLLVHEKVYETTISNYSLQYYAVMTSKMGQPRPWWKR